MIVHHAQRRPAMTRKIYALSLCLVALGCAQPSPQEAPKVRISTAANPDVPQGTRIWKQGMSESHFTSPLAPHAARLTVTPLNEIPVDRIKLPPGFKAEVWAHGMPGARMMTRGPQGKVYVGTRAIGRVYEVTDRGATRETRV